MTEADPRAEPLLSIVIPAYDEAENIHSGVLARVADYLATRSYSHEVLLSDDGSLDETAGLVEAFSKEHPTFRLLRNEHMGKAHAVLAGLMAARGRYIMFMDMDLSTSLDHIDELVDALESSSDVVVASREAKGAVRLASPRRRRLLGKAFNLLIQALVLPGFWDTQCGFKGFRKEVVQDLVSRLVVFNEGSVATGPRVTAFDVELLVIARQRGYRILQLPVTWRHVKTRRVNLVREALLMLRELLAIRWARWRRKYSRASVYAESRFPGGPG